MTKIFISYRSKNSDEVDDIVSKLRGLDRDDGTPEFKVWQDKDSIPSGMDWWQAITDGIRDCDVFMFMMTQATCESKFCLAELSFADCLNKPIIPVVLESGHRFNRESGKYDLDFSYELVPKQINDARVQYLWYRGTSFFDDLDIALKQIESEGRSPHDCPTPPDPNLFDDPNSTYDSIYATAVEYAERGNLKGAEAKFKQLANSENAYQSEANEWITLLRSYARLMTMHERKATHFKLRQTLPNFFKQFPKPFIERFDPKKLYDEYMGKVDDIASQVVGATSSEKPEVIVEEAAPVMSVEEAEEKLSKSDNNLPMFRVRNRQYEQVKSLMQEDPKAAAEDWHNFQQIYVGYDPDDLETQITNFVEKQRQDQAERQKTLNDMLTSAKNASSLGKYQQAEQILADLTQYDTEGEFTDAIEAISRDVQYQRERDTAYTDIQKLIEANPADAVSSWQSFVDSYPDYDPDGLAESIEASIQQFAQGQQERLNTLKEMVTSARTAVNVQQYEVAEQILQEITQYDEGGNFTKAVSDITHQIQTRRERDQIYADLVSQMDNDPAEVLTGWNNFTDTYPDYDPQNLASKVDAYYQQLHQQETLTQKQVLENKLADLNAKIDEGLLNEAQVAFLSLQSSEIDEELIVEYMEQIFEIEVRIREALEQQTWSERISAADAALERGDFTVAEQVIKTWNYSGQTTEVDLKNAIIGLDRKYNAYITLDNIQTAGTTISDKLANLEFFAEDYPEIKTDQVQALIREYQKKLAGQKNPKTITADLLKSLPATEVEDNDGSKFITFDGQIDLFFELPLTWATVFEIAISPDSRYVAMAVNKEIQIWDIVDGELVMTLTGHRKQIDCVAFSPDGKQLASGAHDKTVKLWDINWQEETASESRTIDVGSKIRAVAYSSKNDFLAIGSSGFWGGNSVIKLYYLPSHKFGPEFTTNERIETSKFSPDGRYLAARTDIGKILYIWDVEKKEVVLEQPSESFVLRFDWSNDSQKVAYMNSEGVFVIDLIGNVIASVEDKPIITYAKQDSDMLIGLLDDVLGFWHISGDFYATSITFTGNHLECTPDGKRIVVASDNGIGVYGFSGDVE